MAAYIYMYIYTSTVSLYIYVYAAVSDGKRKIEAQAIFLKIQLLFAHYANGVLGTLFDPCRLAYLAYTSND